ncbi:efflux RND transporter periplasmic adaptor subunit [Cerasicoccus maritimus]|uniref:efflux RND transporter periplasmic adaptor subunit n=1 Tax=Cerasicoccus maritimus TaxID=490089 RepID=UPI00285272D7|nr:efflux RND transporter periplasmic adaptor subunit [Cerasicoccus maritimus]
MSRPDSSSHEDNPPPLTPAESPAAQKRGVTPWKILLPIVILVIAGGLGKLIIESKPEPDKKAPPARVVAVETVTVEPEAIRLSVDSQGAVQPRVQTQLTAEVSGRIESVSPTFREGGFIKKGEVLIQIEKVDYEAALANAQAELAQSKFNLAQEVAQSEQAQADWEDLGRGEPTDLALRKPQLEQAKALIKSAEAGVERAERNLERTTVRAPYDGRVVEQTADVGQFIAANGVLGKIYASDVAEVYLPLSDAELARLDLPSGLDDMESIKGPQVTLMTDFGNRRYTWQGRVVRTGAAFDSRSRLLDVVVEIENPLAADPEQPGRPGLKPGKFVQAHVEGRLAEGSFSIPRFALREGDTVLIAQADDTLTRREVVVIQADTERAVISEGLEAGDRVITSPVEYVIEGMQLVVENGESDAS